MSETHEPNPTPAEGTESVREQVDAIVRSGGDVRKQVEDLVASVAREVQAGGQSLLDVARSVVDGAGDALRKGAASAPPDGAFRQVIDGLGDGLARAALAAKLALEEARDKGRQFASEDLAKLGDDLSTLNKQYGSTLGDALAKARTGVQSELGDLRGHAEEAFSRIKPALQSAIDAVRQDPVGAGKETLGVGLETTRQAAGSLFQAIGGLLDEAGKRLTEGNRPQP